jgi:hypothetical protein
MGGLGTVGCFLKKVGDEGRDFIIFCVLRDMILVVNF